MDLDLSTVQNEIHDARTKWYDIGIELKLDVSTLKAIESKLVVWVEIDLHLYHQCTLATQLPDSRLQL